MLLTLSLLELNLLVLSLVVEIRLLKVCELRLRFRVELFALLKEDEELPTLNDRIEPDAPLRPGPLPASAIPHVANPKPIATKLVLKRIILLPLAA